MMQLFLEPIDVWLFRDGKPFDATSDHRASSLFPPYPSVIQGVIRSHQLVLQGVNLNDPQAIAEAVGTSEDVKDLRLRGPFIAQWDGKQFRRYFPVPADMTPTDSGYVQLKLVQPNPKTLLTSCPTPALLFSSVEPTKRLPGQWLDEPTLWQALRGEMVVGVESQELFACEAYFGIKRQDHLGITERSYLYEAEFIRPRKHVGLYVEISGYPDWPAQGVLRIGGEGRGARYQVLDNLPALPKPPAQLGQRFKVYFATPTYFQNGWLPAREDWSDFFDGNVTLMAAAFNRYESVGGYDWAKNRHKAAYRYVPAGSVYYFETSGTTTLKEHVLQSGAISDAGAQIGFGQIFLQEV
jgi:CRISPR-associated protein Cmr3